MGTGGMRYGAGRPALHVKAEHCKRLDVRRLQRDGELRAGVSGTWAWCDAATGERTGTIGYRVGDGFVDLDYSIDGKPSGQRVEIVTTGCTYGGTRPWFVCPVRGERIAVLYLRAGRFACRHCQRIAYASQSGDVFDRTWRRQRKAEALLGEFGQRPKGMHQATHDRLLSIVRDCEQRRNAALIGFVALLTRRHPCLLDGMKRT